MTTTIHEHVHGTTALGHRGTPLEEAHLGMILVHGRGATAESILTLADELPAPGMAYFAPQAKGHSWYPQSFLAPREANEPGLSSGLQRLDEVVERLVDAGLPTEKIVLLGFSQGACLALDYAARHPRRFAGVVGFSGGLIGPPGMSWDDLSADVESGGLAGTPVFLGCSDRDAHVPVERVRETETVLQRLGGDVETRIDPGMPHTINHDEVSWVKALLSRLAVS